MKAGSPKKESILFYLLILTSFLMLLELSFFIQCNSVYLSDYTFVSKNIAIPASILPGIAYFIFAQFVVHLLYCFGLWVVIELMTELIPSLARKKITVVISIWLFSVMTIFAANQYYFPNSRFAELTSLVLINQHITQIVFLSCVGCLSVITLLAGISLMLKHRQWFILVSMMLIIFSASFIFKPETGYDDAAATASRPNIILIGIDSLRPDFLSYFGYDRPTPFLDSLLDQASVFTEAVTPLARTFPSWSSLLTGQYPREIHIRSNLAEQQTLHLNTTLPAILHKHGYETIYATDETRFSNIDKNFGFDRIIGPPMGLNDFLIGNFNDFPLSNLFINTMMGKLLFPHSYANRPVHFSYDPDSFLQLLKPVLAEKHQQPLFLATHFCLPHAPYVWASLSGKNLNAQARYAASIQRVDEQIRDYFKLLKKNHLLDHAIVVLLSDHGEALEFSGDRITEKELYIPASPAMSSVPVFYPQGLDHEEVNQSAGHGTDVMGLPQYHTLLAFKLYGVEKDSHIGNVSGVVSLLDIKPTLLEFMHIPSLESSGISLLPWIEGHEQRSSLKTREHVQNNVHNFFSYRSQNTFPFRVLLKRTPVGFYYNKKNCKRYFVHVPRHIFLESDYSPAAIRTVYPEVRQVMLEGIDIFQIDSISTRLTVKHSMTAKIIASKQYADIYDEWMLALYPQNKNNRMAILINLNNGQWTNDLHSIFAKNSPAKLMLAELHAFYGSELGSGLT